LLRGQLMIGNPIAFQDLVRRGLGRHRSFGYGMLLLKPPA
jgi:CRISPR system Cascade subunit CasE